MLAVGAQIVLIFFRGTHELLELPGVLLALLGFGKLAVVTAILIFTNKANHGRWNEKAVDYRYLAERLRSTAYLPLAGSLRASPPGSAGYATRVSTQSVVDWLFQG